MIILEESWVSGLLFNRLLYVQLTESEITLAIMLIKRVVCKIPIKNISKIEIRKNILTVNISIVYFDVYNRLKMVDFGTKKYLDWIEAFKSLGIVISMD